MPASSVLPVWMNSCPLKATVTVPVQASPRAASRICTQRLGISLKWVGASFRINAVSLSYMASE